jgi:hypothetical protein
VIRFDYHPSPYRRQLGEVAAVLLTDRLRTPLAAIGAAVLAVTLGWSLEMHRLADLDGALAALNSRVHAAAADDARARGLVANVARLRALHSGLAAARRETLAATNTIALIGNGLPSQTWLTSVGSTPTGSWTIDGRSTRVSEIGVMLRRVQSIDATAAAHLVSIAASGRNGRVLDFVIGWERP